MTNEETRYPGFRWFLLFIGWALFAMLGFNHTIVASRSHDLITALAITDTQFFLLYSATSLAPIVICLVGGALGDRYGVRWVVGVGAAIASVAALLRLVSHSFTPFFLCMALLGVGYGVVFPNLPKLVGEWFPRKQVALATGLYMTGSGVGLALGLAVGAAFETWQAAVLTVSVILAVMTVVWLVLARDRPKGFTIEGRQVTGVPFREGLGRAFRSKNMYWLGFSYFLMMGVVMSYIGGLKLVLEKTIPGGLPPMAAAMFPALAVIGFIIGTMFWAIMSERIGVTKPIYLVCMILTGVCGVIVFYTAPSVTSYLLAFFPGFFIGAGPALVMMQPLRLPEFGPRYAANATGVLTAIHHIGGFIFLPYFFTPVWHSAGGLTAALIVWLGSMVVSGLLILGIPETGRKARERMEAEAASHEA